MNSNIITWKTFDRDLVPLVLFGETVSLNIKDGADARLTIPQGKVAIGFSDTIHNENYTPPVLLLLNDNNPSEILAWLRVYSPDTFPVSQFTRVLTHKDWTLLTQSNSNLPDQTARTDQWSCVILGELLAQSEFHTDISTVPLARAHACFSSTVAQASSTHNSREITKTTINRLQTLESDQRFVTRPLTLADLSTIWELLESFKPNNKFAEEASVIKILDNLKSSNNEDPSNHTTDAINLIDFPDLNSNSVEARVIAFNNLLTKVYALPEKNKKSKITSATLAAAAFLVGRSTSHIFLLSRIGKEFPSSFAWFGLFAAVCGASAWDPEWARATKGIERNLRVKFDWSNPALVDLCWTEYSWLSQISNSKNAISDIPKLSPRVLSIEIVPGANCQLLLAGGLTSSNIENKKYINNSEAKQIRESQETQELRSTIEKFIELAAKAKESLINKSNQQISTQDQFNLETSTVAPKPIKTKRNTKTNPIK
jgi:hypothetical protein